MSQTFVVRMFLLHLLCDSGFGQSRVNQGKEIDIKDAPYMAYVQVALTETSGLGCDGSILSEWFILTAGHCATDEDNVNKKNPPLHDPSAYSLIVGTTDLMTADAEWAYVSKVFLLEYSSTNDLAMLKLSKKLELNGVTKAATRLPKANYSPADKTKARVDGWGSNPQGTHHLLRANIHTTPAKDCDASRYQICTLGDNGAGPCQGDSGGPMYSDGVQIGVVSYVPLNCAHPGQTHSKFTAVAPNLKWIQDTMKNNGGVAASGKPLGMTQKPKPVCKYLNRGG